jgi:lipoprotein-releasing system permease protein
VTAIVAILGISFGVAVLIVALALANGFRDEMRDKILRGTAHITLMRKDGEAMTDWREVVARVREIDGVRDAGGTTYEGALVSNLNGPAYAVLRGVDINSEHSNLELRRMIIEGSLDSLLTDAKGLNRASDNSLDPLHAQREATKDQSSTKTKTSRLEPDFESYQEPPPGDSLPHAIIGTELAARTGLRVGDVVQIISADAQLTPLGLAPRYRRLQIVGIFRSGLYEYDSTWVYVSLPIASSLAGAEPGSASVISIEVSDIYTVDRVSARIRERTGPIYTTVDWQEANRPLFAALTLERRMGLIVVGLIIFIATLNISATLVLVVVERRTDIAILRAMGARARNIMLVFVIEGACVGLIGAIAGVLIGITACFFGERYKLVSLPADVYSLNNIPFHSRAQDVALAAAVAFLLSLLATIYPARVAARVGLAEALRDGN